MEPAESLPLTLASSHWGHTLTLTLMTLADTLAIIHLYIAWYRQPAIAAQSSQLSASFQPGCVMVQPGSRGQLRQLTETNITENGQMRQIYTVQLHLHTDIFSHWRAGHQCRAIDEYTRRESLWRKTAISFIIVTDFIYTDNSIR
jgi:hypothetical protein